MEGLASASFAVAEALENSCLLAYIQNMRRDEVIAKLKKTEPALRDLGVAGLYLFGSHARDEAKSDSDVDVFVDPAPDRDFGFLPFIDAYETIQRRLATPLRSVIRPAQACRPILLGMSKGGGADFLMAASKSPRARLLHIRDEIEGVATIIRGLSFLQYQGSSCIAARWNAPCKSFQKPRKRCRRITSPNTPMRGGAPLSA